VVAVVWQPVAGNLSDRTRTPWGRRRPFMLAGTAGDLVFLLGLARFAAGPVLDHFNPGPRILHLPGGCPVIFGMFVAWLVLGTLLVLPVRTDR